MLPFTAESPGDSSLRFPSLMGRPSFPKPLNPRVFFCIIYFMTGKKDGLSEDSLKALEVKIPLKESLLGEASFYRKVAFVVVPMIIQNTLTNVVGLLDNVMVGQVGTLPMSAVAIVNQLIFIYYLCIWGGLAGVGIYSTQFFGKGDYDGVRYAMRFKLILGTVITAATIIIFIVFSTPLIGNYIAVSTSAADKAATLKYAKQYLDIMLIGFIPFTLTQGYAGTLRESGQTSLPMKAGMIAMVVNFIFNALLIFGLFGFPKLGVAGAAIATVISRFVEMFIVVLAAHFEKNKQKNEMRYPFFGSLYRSFTIPGYLIPSFIAKTLPLLLGEFTWSFGQATLLQCYSVRGLDVVAAMNISSTVSQIFNEVFLSLGNATAILIGQELGANRLVSARRMSTRMMFLSVTSCFVMGFFLFLCSPFIPRIYNTEPSVRELATAFIRVVSMTMFCNAVANVSYFTLRAGGKTIITFLFDAGATWLLSVPVAFFLTRFTSLPIVLIYFLVCVTELFKGFIGIGLVKQGSWVRKIV